MEKTDEAVATLIERLSELTETYGSPAYEALMFGIQVDAVFQIITSITAMVVGLGLVRFFIPKYQAVRGGYGEADIGWAICIAFSATGAALGFISFLAANWLALISPEAYLARELVLGR